MGKTRRKEKIFNDFLEESQESVSDDVYRDKGDKRRKKKQIPVFVPPEDYERDEDYGYFEKIGKRR